MRVDDSSTYNREERTKKSWEALVKSSKRVVGEGGGVGVLRAEGGNLWGGVSMRGDLL